MKFLSKTLDGSNLMALNVYYSSGTRDYTTPDDVLDFIYKDMDTGKKYVETIHNPKVEVYIVKPEFRTFDYYKNFVKIEQCDKYLVSYKFRYSSVRIF